MYVLKQRANEFEKFAVLENSEVGVRLDRLLEQGRREERRTVIRVIYTYMDNVQGLVFHLRAE